MEVRKCVQQGRRCLYEGRRSSPDEKYRVEFLMKEGLRGRLMVGRGMERSSVPTHEDGIEDNVRWEGESILYEQDFRMVPGP